ncbi:MAG TPA: hypothetical protein VFX24_03255 [Ktedonobacterales bacterium]|jgi:hypothetical protein|nr:hypothetical protein [Ktedonobacterales bacterium]
MTYRRHFAWRWVVPLFLLTTLAVIALSACGTRGNPPALGKAVQVTLSAGGAAATLGHATLTPAYGAHVVVYMHGALVPYDSPQTPAQLREGSCYGKVVAPLTSNAPTGGSAVVQAATDKGANVALPVDANWYVVVLESAAPNAAVTACGHPLNNMRQYFDLYEPDKVDQGVGLGIALYEGIVITQVHVALAAPTTKQSTEWSIHSGGCQGSTLASGAIASGATTGSGIAFAPLDAKTWWLAVATDGATDPATCVKAG